MPGVICYRARPQDCASLGHLYRSSPNAAGTRPIRVERQSLRRHATRRAFEKSPSSVRVSLPLLLLLSSEVVLLVLAELPGRDILLCRCLCKPLKQFIDQSMKLRYIVEAHARGLEPLQNPTSAQYRVQQLFARERSWAMFGAVSGTHVILDPPNLGDDDDETPPPIERILYDAGKIIVCRGEHVSVLAMRPGAGDGREYVVPGLRNAMDDGVVALGERIAFSTPEAVCVYSLASAEIVQTLAVPRRGTIGTLRMLGDYLAVLFCPERQSGGVLLWNWRSGKLIDLLHSAGAPTLSFAFLNPTEIAIVRTNRSARSARLDIYAMTSSSSYLRASLALPDTHPTKWYARADIHCGGSVPPPGCESMQHDQGIIVIDLKLRVRSPHDPAATNATRRLSTVLIVHKKALANSVLASPSFSDRTAPIPWSAWSSNRFRFLTNVRVTSQFPTWGSRVIATGPESDKLALFDFCSVGVKAVSRVWKTPGTWGGSLIPGGTVSVRAALAQRTRTLVRAGSLELGAGWFEGFGLDLGSGDMNQMPYVVSVRRDMAGVESVGLDGERVVSLANEENLEGMSVPKVTSFVFSV